MLDTKNIVKLHEIMVEIEKKENEVAQEVKKLYKEAEKVCEQVESEFTWMTESQKETERLYFLNTNVKLENKEKRYKKILEENVWKKLY